MSDYQTAEHAVSRRTALRLLGSSTGMLLLAACGQQATTPPAATAVPKSVGTTAPAAPAPTATAVAASSKPAAVVPTSTPAAVAAVTPAAAQPRRGGTLRVAIPIDIAQLDGHFRTAPVYDSIWHVYETLTSY